MATEELTTATVTSKDGTKIAYDQVGEGAPLILVGGATQHRAVDQTTAELARRLGEQFTVISYDRRGRGDSGDTLPYAPEREYEDLEALIASVGGEAHVFGMSSGAVLAVEAAAGGAAISKLVMYEAPLRIDLNGPPPVPDYVETIEGIIRDGEPGDAMAYFMAMVGQSEEEIAAFRETPVFQAFAAVEHTLAYDGRIMEPYSLGEPIPPGRWDGATQPTLVIAGGDSPDWFKSAARAAADALPNAELRTLAGQTHRFDPEVLAPALVEFLSD
jgi:pimeloyl-ACP methyl ester carboxylesterase